MRTGYHRTFYIFRSGNPRRELNGPDRYFKYKAVLDIAFTTDHTGSNLPQRKPPWEFGVEIQTEERSLLSLDGEEDRVWTGLDEKGWYVTKAVLGVSIRPNMKWLQPENAPPSPAERQLSPQAESILNKILKR